MDEEPFNPIPPSVGLPLVFVLLAIIGLLGLLYRYFFMERRICLDSRCEDDNSSGPPSQAKPVHAFSVHSPTTSAGPQSFLPTIALPHVPSLPRFRTAVYPPPTGAADSPSSSDATMAVDTGTQTSNDPAESDTTAVPVLSAAPPALYVTAAANSPDLYAVPAKADNAAKKSVRFAATSSRNVSSASETERASRVRAHIETMCTPVDDLELRLDPRTDPASFFNRGIKP